MQLFHNIFRKTYTALANFDLDGDWDPEKHDQQMAIMYEGDDDKEVCHCIYLTTKIGSLSLCSGKRKTSMG